MQSTPSDLPFSSLSETELIAAINKLAHKQKADGLSPDEITEQALLRAEYIRRFRENLRHQLDSIHIVDKNKGKPKSR